MTLPVSDDSALGQLVAILDAQVSRVDGIAGNGGAAETKASDAVDAATAWGAQEHVQAAEEVRKEIAEANAAIRQCKERYEAALTRAHSLEHGGGSGRSTASASGSTAYGGAASARTSTSPSREERRAQKRGKHRATRDKRDPRTRPRLPSTPALGFGLAAATEAWSQTRPVLPSSAQAAGDHALGSATAVVAGVGWYREWKAGKKKAGKSERKS